MKKPLKTVQINYSPWANAGYRDALREQYKQVNRERFYREIGFQPIQPKLTWRQWLGWLVLGFGLVNLIWRSRRHWEYIMIGAGAYMVSSQGAKRKLAKRIHRYID